MENGENPKKKYGDAKLPLALVPPAGPIYMAYAFKEGARKYGAYNWREKKVEMMTYLNATLRHFYALLDGEWIDPDSPEPGYPHIAAIMACMAILADAKETGNLVDNRPPAGAAPILLKVDKPAEVA